MSTLNVDKVDPSSGTALEIGSSGDTVTVPSGATFAVSGTMNASSITAGTLAEARGGTGTTSYSPGMTEANQLRITTDFSPAGDVTANWERNDTNFDKIGTGMTESSGIFTFPSTGIYSVDWDIVNVINANSRELKTRIFMTVNDSAYTAICENGSFVARTDSNNTYGMGHANAIVDITDTANRKVKFYFDNEGSVGTCKGSSALNLCWATFLRLGDT